ncbi:hypothetical protein RW1_069_00070 [Rhodococcus wratislaviensis NBRC 100605]|uniref:Uncharacterized protein n=1 Tax=Rhodococcus wratislaviensis NBRC 100605 TaxID=1219028 RepID=X0PZL7_RHOWR|nr:hypothetical protein RW1_069_00070 [Rhodococcus wratislaviensis NBRC 100605]
MRRRFVSGVGPAVAGGGGVDGAFDFGAVGLRDLVPGRFIRIGGWDVGITGRFEDWRVLAARACEFEQSIGGFLRVEGFADRVRESADRVEVLQSVVARLKVEHSRPQAVVLHDSTRPALLV